MIERMSKKEKFKEMKLACAVTTYETPSGPIIFRDGKLKENIKLMKKYGFCGMDLFIKKTGKEKLREYRKLLEDNDMRVATLFAIYLGENGVKLTDPDPNHIARFIDLMKEQLDIAKEIGALGLGLGYIRGCYYENETEKEALKRLAEVLHVLGDYADEIGTKILLEPINRYEINTLNRAVDAVDFIKNNHLKGIDLQLDMFHMNIEDSSIFSAIKYAKGMIGNLHISSSNRHAVGTGHFDFPKIIACLKENAYDGFLTLEAFSDNPEETLKMTSEHLQKYL